MLRTTSKVEDDNLRRTMEQCIASEMRTLKQDLWKKVDKKTDDLSSEMDRKFQDQKAALMEFAIGGVMDKEAYVADQQTKELRKEIERENDAKIRELQKETDKLKDYKELEREFHATEVTESRKEISKPKASPERRSS